MTIIEAEKQIAELNAKVEDLTQRLKTSLCMSSINHNQELLTLKANIASAITPEYEDYQIGKDVPYDADEYIARGASLHRIFRCLKRLGVLPRQV
jgi:hypothetical protein